MKTSFLISVILFNIVSAFAQTTQTYNTDSLKRLLSKNLPDTSRIWVLNNLSRNIQNSDTTLLLADQAIVLSRKTGFKKGEAEAYNNIAYWYNQKGNYPRALANYLQAIKLAESVNYEAGLRRSFNSISTVYIYLKNYNTSISYARKARKLSLKSNDASTRALASAWLGRSFLALHLKDSALKYAQESYEVASQLKEPFPLYLATAQLGAINEAQGNHSLALEYLRLSLGYSKTDGRYFRIAGAHQQLAEIFKTLGAKDSCLHHAKEAFYISYSHNLSGTLLSSSLLLSELYERKNDAESLRFHKVAMVAQDSLYSQEKNRQVEELSLDEKLRQQEIEAAQRKVAEERKNNLQYAAIALGLVLFVILFLLLGHSIIATPRLITFLGTLALLIVFEFINLLIHPFLGNLTHHSPLLMLVFMVGIAALLIPIHHRLEKWVTHKLVEKNRMIRLEAAKKVIAKMERESN